MNKKIKIDGRRNEERKAYSYCIGPISKLIKKRKIYTGYCVLFTLKT
jgi:hypothetical protein